MHQCESERTLDLVAGLPKENAKGAQTLKMASHELACDENLQGIGFQI